jgi:hypothetical protein
VNADGTVSNTTNAKTALVAVQTDADRLRSTAEAVDHATGLGLTMVQDMGGLVGLSSYAYSLQLWAERKLNMRIRFFNWSGDDPGISEMETRIENQLRQLGDDHYRPIGNGFNVSRRRTAGEPRDRNTGGVIWRDDPYSIVLCAVQDVSPAGAGLLLPGGVSPLPPEFDLTFDRVTRRCIAVWQHLDRMGVKFKSI